MSARHVMSRSLSIALLRGAVLAAAAATGSDSAATVALRAAPADTVRRPIPYPVVPSRGFLKAVENGTRTTSGRPGPAYWQQWADYELAATLRPAERRLYGKGRIAYHNRSPDSLSTVYLHLMQNVHAVGAMRMQVDQPGPQDSAAQVDGWDVGRVLAHPVYPGNSPALDHNAPRPKGLGGIEMCILEQQRHGHSQSIPSCLN